MSHDRNLVRDRTLVLRVLVPGLHTSLNDKIAAKKEGAASTASSSASPLAPGLRMSADQLLNLDGVACMPSSAGSTLWHFRCDGATYPARLVNLPCPVEVHKTHDHANYIKSADVGQMLIVYEDEYAMEEAENEKGYKIEGFPSYYHSGLSPPMRRVVQRRYLSRFEERDTKPVPPPREEVAAVEKELKDLIAKLSTGKGKPKKKTASTAAKDKVITEIEEEIVDYEPWMGEGGIFTVEHSKMHPEWWLSQDEMKEIDAVKRAAEEEEEEKLRKEREAKEAEQKKSAEKAEKKRKKKEKKKKLKEEEAKASAEKMPKGGEIDEVTAAALTINEGIEGDEDFLFGGDDMFDFENEDITDLLG